MRTKLAPDAEGLGAGAPESDAAGLALVSAPAILASTAIEAARLIAVVVFPTPPF